MPSCVVSFCRNHSTTHNKRHRITFHKFPRESENKSLWIAAIRASRNDELWLPSTSSVVCSDHFDNEDVYHTKHGRNKITKGSYPKKKTGSRSLSILRRFVHNEYLTTQENNGTREIILNHEKTKNSLSLDMMNHLIEAINNNKEDISLRAIVLSAKGNVFSAGHNLKELKSVSGDDQCKLIFNKATELMKSVVLSPVPVIAKVNGLATAAGCQLVATCDMIVCSDTSKFSTPGANFGIFCSTPGIALGRCVPKSKATYMLFTGEPISAQDAHQSGLVTKVVSANELDNEVEKIIEKIKLKSRSVITLGKQFFYQQIELGLFNAYELGEKVMVDNIASKDGQEGLISFVEKRKAKWSHR